MKNISKASLAVLVTAIITCGLFCQRVQAVQISGNITFTGTCNLNTKSASTATMVTGWHGLGTGGLPQVLSHDGSFNGSVTDGGAVTNPLPWSFNCGAVPTSLRVYGFV